MKEKTEHQFGHQSGRDTSKQSPNTNKIPTQTRKKLKNKTCNYICPFTSPRGAEVGRQGRLRATARENRRPKEGHAEKGGGGKRTKKDPKDQPRECKAEKRNRGDRAAGGRKGGGKEPKKNPKEREARPRTDRKDPRAAKEGGAPYCIAYPMERKNGTSFRPPLGPIVSRHEQTKAHCYNVLL